MREQFKDVVSMTYKNGIHIESELKRYQEKAAKYDKLVSLAKEENKCRTRIREIGQERAKLIGVTMKYRADMRG